MFTNTVLIYTAETCRYADSNSRIYRVGRNMKHFSSEQCFSSKGCVWCAREWIGNL